MFILCSFLGITCENAEIVEDFTDFVALNSCNDDISSLLIDHYLSRESVSVRIKSDVL